MQTFKIYQIDLASIHNEINKLGHDGAAAAYPQYHAFLECSFTGDGYIPQFAQYFTLSAECLAVDDEECFEIMNRCDRQSDDRVKLHSDHVHSLSVGDVIIDENGNALITAGCGFENIEFDPNSAIVNAEKAAEKLGKIDPSEIRIGDHLANYDFVYEVTSIKVFCRDTKQLDNFNHLIAEGVELVDHSVGYMNQDEPIIQACFGVRGTFVSGNRKKFEYFRPTICAGPKCGTREKVSYQQGNALATWTRVAK